MLDIIDIPDCTGVVMGVEQIWNLSKEGLEEELGQWSVSPGRKGKEFCKWIYKKVIFKEETKTR